MDKQDFSRQFVLVLVVVAITIAVTAMVMHQRDLSRPLDDAQREVAADRKQVLAELADARAELKRMNDTLETFRAAARERYNAEDAIALGRLAEELAQAPAAGAVPVTPTPAPPKAPEPEPNLLVPGERSVAVVPDGLMGSMRFTPTKDEPLTMLWLIVRLPKGSTERILDLAPVDTNDYEDISWKISPEGTFAAFKAMPKAPKPLDFNLKVSGPVTAHIRGTCGIDPFAFEMRADQ